MHSHSDFCVKHPVQCGYLCQGQCQFDDDGDDSAVRSLMWKWRHLLSGEPLINTDAQFVFRILGNPRV